MSTTAVVLIALCSFAGGYIVRSPEAPAGAFNPLPEPVAETADDVAERDTNEAIVAADAAAAAADAAAIASPFSRELATPESPLTLGDISLGSMTEFQWTAFWSEFLQKNPGLLQLDGFASLVAEELSSSTPTMAAEVAAKAAMGRASKRWTQRQEAPSTALTAPPTTAETPASVLPPSEVSTVEIETDSFDGDESTPPPLT